MAHRIIHHLLSVVIPGLSSEYIRWPTHAQFGQIANGFNLKSPNIPSFIAGAIDCKEIAIMPPKEDPGSYFNRKHFHSIKLQAIVDHEGKFMDTFIG